MALTAKETLLLNELPHLATEVKLGDKLVEATPAYKVVYAGSFTTVGGDANEAITVTGALNTDIAFVMVNTAGAVPRSIVSADVAADAINVVMSGDPAADHVLVYQVLRAV